MKLIAMNTQVAGRYRRSSGLKLKGALRLATVLGICIWLLYKINHHHDQKLVYDDCSPGKFSQLHSILGRKLNIGWLACRNESGSEGGVYKDKPDNWQRGPEDDPLVNKHLKETSIMGEVQQNDSREGSNGDGFASLIKERPGKDSLNVYQENLNMEEEIDENKPEAVPDNLGKHDLFLESKDEDGVFTDKMDSAWQHGPENSFDDENGVPAGLNDVTGDKYSTYITWRPDLSN